MKTATFAFVAAAAQTANAFLPAHQERSARVPSCLKGYLDDLGAIGPPEEVEEDDSREATMMNPENVDRFGAGSWEGFVDFDEFDGGDGQMGVAGDGNSKLDKFDMSEIAKSRQRSARNAWGTSSGYADTLVAKGVDQSRAQQLENWHNQQEVLNRRRQQRFMTDDFDKVSEEEDWRNLASFGVSRNQVSDYSCRGEKYICQPANDESHQF